MPPLLPLALVFSAVYFGIANLCVRTKTPMTCLLAMIPLPFVTGCFCFMAFPPVIVQSLLMPLVLLLARRTSDPHKAFLRLGGAAVVLAYLIMLPFSLAFYRNVEGLKRQYPIISLEDRVPVGRWSALNPTDHAFQKRLAEWERKLEEQAEQRDRRAFALSSLHRYWVHSFINSPGFGLVRLQPRFGDLPARQPGPRDISQPGSLPTAQPSRDPLSSDSPADRLLIEAEHRNNVVDFVNPLGFGSVRDRSHAIGFQEHSFSEPPKLPQLRRIELVSLLLHAPPAVYVSENLPRMDKMRDFPTRALDGFEQESLRTLQRGEDLVLKEQPEHIRMLGAIRSLEQCIKCHGGERGDLLGAFSYVLGR